MNAATGEVTQMLVELRRGSKEAEGRLIPLVYGELRRIAATHLRREAPQHSLRPTALAHEAYLRLIKIQEVDWQSRSHFFAVSSTLMRRILVDHARAGKAHKRGDGFSRQMGREGTNFAIKVVFTPLSESSAAHGI